MYAYIEGKIEKLTDDQEEVFVEELKSIEVPQIVTDKDRISALESAVADLAIMMAMGGSTDA